MYFIYIIYMELNKLELVDSLNAALKSEAPTALFGLFTLVKILFGKQGHP